MSVSRRQFLKASATTAAVAATGVEGILAAGRAPAYAQGRGCTCCSGRTDELKKIDAS